MTEDQYYPSYLDEQTSNSTVNTGCDFNKYDPYVEKIRTLFVPSLEPRIYSCLETFVYREDHEALLEPPYLKRCLDVAATWREPVYAFSTKLGDLNFLEKMLTQAVKYFIKDGLIDCFLNSIILNNRLNKVCRNLDAAGVEKDFLRYLAVWNYINEKDYWIENDSIASTSMMSPSYDSMESCSDLDVQVGSGLDSGRTKRCCKQASDNNDDFPENRCRRNFCSHLNMDSGNYEGSNNSSWNRKKPRLTSPTYPCQPWNCPSYRTKISEKSDWEGKTLKLRVCKLSSNSPTNFDRGQEKPCRLSRLPLPCKFDDMIADIFKADQSVPRLSSITMSKKLRASVIDICRCINETMRKMSKEEVKRCRFHCEILPGFVTFKLIQRETNGCKTCLFSDRIAIDNIDGQFTPRGTSFSQKFENIDEENIDNSDLPIFESTRIDFADEDSHLVSSLPIETKNETEPAVTNSIRLPETELDASNHQKPNEFVRQDSPSKLSENHVDDQTCECSSSILDSCENPDPKEEGNTVTSRVEGSETTGDPNNSVESPEKAALAQSSGNAIEDQSCYCSNPDNNKIEISNQGSEKTQDTDYVDRIESTKAQNIGKKMPPEDDLNHFSGNQVEDQTCRCIDSFPYTFSNGRDSANNQGNDCDEFLKTHVEDFKASNREESCQDAYSIIPEYHKMSNTNNTETGPSIDKVENDQPFFINQSRFENLPSEAKSRNEMTNEMQCDGIRGCECPDSCECINRRDGEHDVEECDSQCSCDNCRTPEKSRPLNSVSEDTRISSSIYPEQSSKVNSSIPSFVRPIVTEKSQYFDTAGSSQLQPNGVKSEDNSWNLQRPKNYPDTSTKPKISSKAKAQFSNTEVEETCPTRTNYKSVQILIEESPNSVMNETSRTLANSKSHDYQHDLGKCDSQCSCNSCELLEKSTTLNHGTNVTRISPLVNPQRPSKKYQDTSAKSKISLASAVSKTPLLGTEIEETWRTRTSFKSVQTVTEKLPSVIKETKKTLTLARSPIRIDTGRASSSRSQRINISIELCSESHSSGSLKNDATFMLPTCPNSLMRSDLRNSPSMWSSRCHSADARISRKQAIFESEKNTKDECLRHLRGINACVHSPPRPLESRDYLPPSEPLPRMGNPIVYGMSTKSERQSMGQHKRRKNGLKYSRNNENCRCYNEFQKNGQVDNPDELPKRFSPSTKKPKNVSSSVIHNNLCHAFSASSVDRMKHLIKTKLRKILLERDKATNTPKTSLANEKYRVSVPNGKTKCLPLPRQRCHTIWESRSASASTHTSKTFRSNGPSFAKVSEGDEIKTLFNSTTDSKVVTSDHRNLEACENCNKIICYCLRSSNQSVVSSRIIDQRLVGGSDAPCQKGIDREFQCLWKQRQESVKKCTNREIRYVHNHCDDSFSSKSINRSCTGNSIAGDASSKPSRLCDGADCEEEVTLNERRDEIMKCPGKLDWSGNSTSRHIYLYEYDNFESSNDGEADKWCEPKIYSPKCNSLPICKQGRIKKDPRITQKAHKKNCRQTTSRSSRRQFAGEPNMPRNIRASRFAPSKIHATSNIKSQKGFGKLDQDLRSKLLQYVRLCKNVKYSLLKMLRPDDVYDVRRLSIPRANRYKFRDS